MHEPIIAAAPVVQSTFLDRVRAIPARFLRWMGPLYPDGAPVQITDADKEDLREFSGMMTALPVAIMAWIVAFHLAMWLL